MSTSNITTKSIFITGANGGMGLETSKLLAKLSPSRLLLATRTEDKANFAYNNIRPLTSQGTSLEKAFGFDMNKPEAIEKAVNDLPTNQPFDILFFQVGGVFFDKDYQYNIYQGKRIEKTLFQNAIGAYITLVNLMKKGLVAKNARIVFAGGEGARGIPGMIEKPVFNTESEYKNYVFGNGNQKPYNPMNAIGVSKLSSALLTQKLATLNDGNSYIWFTPGLTHGTNGLAHAPAIKRFVMEKIMFGISGALGFSQSAQKGANKYVNCLTGNIGKNGDVLGAPEGKVLGKIIDQKPMNPSLTNENIINAFWNILQELYPMPITQTI